MSAATATASTSQAGEKVVDLLVVYTDAVLAHYGGQADAIRQDVELAVADANDAYEASGIHQRLALAGVERTGYTAVDDYGTNLDRLQETNDGHGDGIHRLRDRLAADVVTLLVDPAKEELCGIANLAWVSSSADDDAAFSVVNTDCLNDFTLPHEIGHIGGAHHDIGADPSMTPPYAHGFVSVDGRWRTVMAYDQACEEEGVVCNRIARFSNPDRSFDGRATGNATADNRKRLNETVDDVRGFRIRGPRVGLYEGNNQTQDHVCVVSVAANKTVDFTASNSRNCDNDEARSFVLFEVPAGRVLRFYDSPTGSTEDDWVEVVVRNPITEKVIGSFETFVDDVDLAVTYHRNNSLDGKVSRLVVASSAVGPTIDFYEGNGATQNMVCSQPVNPSRSVRFTDPGNCDNDEARSASLYDMPAGKSIRVYDEPNGSTEDDWVEIYIKRAFRHRDIASFQATSEDADVRLIYHRNNSDADALDGKVSRVTFSASKVGATVDLYEGASATQNLVCSRGAASNNAWNFQDSPDCDNDETKSLVIYDMPAGKALRLFDSPSGSREDDWIQIEPLTFLNREVISDLEHSYNNGRVRVTYFRNNGLNGLVSRLEVVSQSSITGVVSFYEGNNGTQNKLCDRNLYDRTIKFSGECDNDEARSLVLTLVKAGTIIRVYDDPDCETGDDWTKITVRRDLTRVTVGTFESDSDNDNFARNYHPHNGLDGKVSCATISVP